MIKQKGTFVIEERNGEKYLILQPKEQTKRILESVRPEVAEQITKKQGRPPKNENEKLRGYRYNLNLDRDLKEYLHDVAWRKRTSITQYINDLIRADMENGEEWKKREHNEL